MKYLSLFSGIGGFEVALKNHTCVGFSEIEKYAILIYLQHFPKHKNFGDILKIKSSNLPDFDLLVGGSPCQDLSIAKVGREGLLGSRSNLFYQFVRILREKNPKYFILENVASMKKDQREIISSVLGVEPILINANLVSAQNRRRLFWTNIPNISLPKDQNILLKDILEKQPNKKHYLLPKSVEFITNPKQLKRKTTINTEKALCLTARGIVNRTGTFIKDKKGYRKLTPIECERLQNFPDNWTEGLSDTQRYRLLGNAVNVKVVESIIKNLEHEKR